MKHNKGIEKFDFQDDLVTDIGRALTSTEQALMDDCGYYTFVSCGVEVTTTEIKEENLKFIRHVTQGRTIPQLLRDCAKLGQADSVHLNNKRLPQDTKDRFIKCNIRYCEKCGVFNEVGLRPMTPFVHRNARDGN
jgi:hypothetical protein